MSTRRDENRFGRDVGLKEGNRVTRQVSVTVLIPGIPMMIERVERKSVGDLGGSKRIYKETSRS